MRNQKLWLTATFLGVVVAVTTLMVPPVAPSTGGARCKYDFACPPGQVCIGYAPGQEIEGYCRQASGGCDGSTAPGCTAIVQGHTVSACCGWNNVICFCPFSGNPNYQIISNFCGH